MQAVIETRSFLSSAKSAGMTEEEREAVVAALAANPQAGDLMQGTGGCRKFRWRKPGSGKSGGYRVITYYGGDEIPVFLLATFGKGDKANLTQGERNALAALTGTLAESLRRKK